MSSWPWHHPLDPRPPVVPRMRTIAVVLPVGGAWVLLDDVIPPGPHEGTTNQEGYVEFAVSNLSVSRLVVEAEGYQVYVIEGLALPPGDVQIRVGVPRDPSRPQDVLLGPLVPLTPPLVTLPRLRARGQFFELETGQRWTAVECSDFNLLNRWQHGEDIEPILSQRAELGFNLLRVWTLYDLAAANIGVFLDIDYARIPNFLQACAQHGLYVECTAYTSTERPDHWDHLVEACQGSSSLLELVNEENIPVNAIDLNRYARPSCVLASHGSNGSEQLPVTPHWNYVTFHTNGAYEEQRKVGHNAWEIWRGPTLTNETSRCPDVGMWRGADPTRTEHLAFDSAAGAALLCAGSCFHSIAGKASTLFMGIELTAATAWAAGARSVDLAFQDAPYRHGAEEIARERALGLLRCYRRGDSPFVDIRR